MCDLEKSDYKLALKIWGESQNYIWTSNGGSVVPSDPDGLGDSRGWVYLLRKVVKQKVIMVTVIMKIASIQVIKPTKMEQEPKLLTMIQIKMAVVTL